MSMELPIRDCPSASRCHSFLHREELHFQLGVITPKDDIYLTEKMLSVSNFRCDCQTGDRKSLVEHFLSLFK